MNLSESQRTNIVIIISFSLHIIASYFSSGWYNPDEQSCILEFVNIKLGNNSNPCFLDINEKNEVLIHSNIKVRSWIQPLMYYSIAKISYFFNINDIFKITFLFRLFSSIVGFYSIYYFYNKTKNHFTKDVSKKIYLFLSFLICYITVWHARTSAENLSISFLLIGIGYLYSNHNNFNNFKLFLLGLIFGASFVLRYNLGISILFILLWFFFFTNKKRVLGILVILSGILIINFFDIIATSWAFDINFLNRQYFNSHFLNSNLNLSFILDRFPAYQFLICGINNNYCGGGIWNVKPFLYYFYFIMIEFFPPFSLIILFSMIYFWFKNYKHVLVWATLPFFIIHSIIPHKEIRYIFPILAFSPYFISFFIEKLKNNILKSFIFKKLIIFFIVFNFAILIFFTIKSPRPELKVLRYIYDTPEIKNIYLVNLEEEISSYESINPFNLDNLTHNYYFKFNKNFLVTQDSNNNNKILWTGIRCDIDCVQKENIALKSVNSSYYRLILENKKKKEIIIFLKNLKINKKNEIFKNINFNREGYILTKSSTIFNKLVNTNGCSLLKTSVPPFVLKLSFNNINKRISNLGLFYCELEY